MDNVVPMKLVHWSWMGLWFLSFSLKIISGKSDIFFLLRRKQGNTLQAQCNSRISEPLNPFPCPKLMDMSVLCSGFPHTLFRPLLLPSPIVPSVTPSATIASAATRNSQLPPTTTTTTVGEEPFNNVKKNNGNGTATVVRKRRHSTSYLERQSAILEVEQASDLESAVSRYCVFHLCVCVFVMSN